MKKIAVIGLDLLMVTSTFFLYNDFISKKNLGTEYVGLAGFAFLAISFSLNIIAYSLALIINYFKKSVSFAMILYMIKLLFATLYFYFFFIKSNYENKLSETFFIVCSLLSGGVIQLVIEYFSKIVAFFEKGVSYWRNLK